MKQLAQGPSQQASPIPYGLVSLWDMINFSLYDFVWSVKFLSQAHVSAVAKSVGQGNDRLSDADRDKFIADLENLNRICRVMLLERAMTRLDRLFTDLRTKSATYKTVATDLKYLYQAIEDDIETERFYHYPKDKGLLILRVPGDWAATLRAFPSSKEDVESAVDCYALGHNNASIHHCMMVLEFGLPALASKLNARFNPDKATWADLTKKITDKILAERAAMAITSKGGKPLSRATAKKRSAFLEACEEAAIEFKFFTTVWRNHVAHGRGDYDENDAKKVLDHVRDFMEIITTKLKLKEE